jgi:hypothetical protein
VPSTRNTDLLAEAQSRALAPAAEAPAAEAVSSQTQFYFCLEASHPGGPAGRADIFDLSRHFTYSGSGAAICPLCKRRVTAVPVADSTQLPPSLAATKERLEVAERNSR